MDRNALLASTRAEFMRSFLAAFDELLPRARTSLFSAADASYSGPQQHQLIAAFKLLNERHGDLRQQLMRSMDQLLNRSFQTTYSTFRPSFSASFAGDTILSLVDANQYEDQLHIDEVTRRFRNAAEEQLRDLNIRIAILFEQDSLNERENPFRPFLLVRAIATAIDNMGQRIENNQILFDRLTTDIEPAVAAIYSAVNRHLSEHGIAAQLQLKIQKTMSAKVAVDSGSEPDANADTITRFAASDTAPARAVPFDDGRRALSSDQPRRRVEQLFDVVRRIARPVSVASNNGDAFSAGTSDSNAEQASADHHDDHVNRSDGGSGYGDPGIRQRNDWFGAYGVANTLRQFFSAPTGATSSIGSSTTSATQISRPISARLGASISALIAGGVPNAEHMSVNGSAGDVRNLIFEQRSVLSDASADSDEQMTIDVVAMLFEFILRDTQIPAEVRAQLGRLQFLVLKVALRESALLTQQHHPARLLVNRIGTISVGLQQLDPSGARIAFEIIRIVETLLANASDNSDLFYIMLDEFDAFIARELRSRDSNVDCAAQAVENAESRTLRFARLAAQLGDVLTGLSIDPYLHQFLNDTWVHVIERAERTDAEHATVSRRFRQLVPDLLWSMVPKNSAPERSRLITLLPVIVGTVRQGLAMEDWPEPRQHELLDWLVAAHSRSLRGSDPSTPDLSLAAMNEHFENFLMNIQEGDSADLADASNADMSTLQNQFLAEALNESALAVDLLDPLVDMANTLPMDFAKMPGSTADLPYAAPAHDAASEQTTMFERLRQGVAISITVGTEPLLASVSYKSQTALVLTMANHGAPSMISVRMFLRLCAMRRVTFIEAAPLFERAVQSLLASADELEKQAA